MAPEREVGPVAVPPPVIYIVALILGVAINSLVPVRLLPRPWSVALGIIVIVVSAAIMPPVLLRFRSAGTPFDVRKPAAALITDGPYRFSRHPGYVALTLLYIGLSLVLDNAWALLLVLPVVVLMDRWVIRREERHLEARFPAEYRRYRAQVRRWL